ncbi:Mbov_0401 family ICE element transposase-like protein [Spiroplasma endosymbiont of Virgichneumon dumeticola]|uniref:Mbov_0401 family ICE element transposase-like protein n=1 Tax=Spiroplasma endosymbiont of Virgichneumon dumeticola TaxID=3139323 RepID=UPI0035C905CD
MFSFKEFQAIEINNSITKFVKKVENWDEYFFQTRDKDRYKVAKKCNRTINIEIGFATFNRRVYWDKIEKRYRYFTDEEFNIEKRARIIKDLKQEIASYLGRKKHYQDIQDILKYTYVSKVTISKIYKNAKIEEKLPEQKFKVKNNEFIYINADDCFVPVWNKNNKREMQKIRSISYNTGKKQIGKNRNKLLYKIYTFMGDYKYSNKEYYLQANPTVDFTWNGLKKYFEFETAKLVVSGDGAKWIYNLAKYLGAYYVFDKYHAFYFLWTAYKPDKRKNKVNPENLKNFLIAWKYFCKGQYDELIAFLIETNINKDTLKTFVNNKEGIINQPASWNIGCSAESDIQHLVKSQTKGAKIYAYPTLLNK